MEIKVLKVQDRKGYVTDGVVDLMEVRVDGEFIVISVNGVLMWVSAKDFKEVINDMEVWRDGL